MHSILRAMRMTGMTGTVTERLHNCPRKMAHQMGLSYSYLCAFQRKCSDIKLYAEQSAEEICGWFPCLFIGFTCWVYHVDKCFVRAVLSIKTCEWETTVLMHSKRRRNWARMGSNMTTFLDIPLLPFIFDIFAKHCLVTLIIKFSKCMYVRIM